MNDPAVLRRVVADVTRQVRLRRAEFYGLRGLFAGAIAGAVPLVFRESLGDPAYLLAAGLLLAGGLAGALYGFVMTVPADDAARLTDRGYGLQERVSTALEWSERPDAGELTGALVADAARRAADLPRRRVIGRRFPREAQAHPDPAGPRPRPGPRPPDPLADGWAAELLGVDLGRRGEEGRARRQARDGRTRPARRAGIRPSPASTSRSGRSRRERERAPPASPATCPRSSRTPRSAGAPRISTRS